MTLRRVVFASFLFAAGVVSAQEAAASDPLATAIIKTRSDIGEASDALTEVRGQVSGEREALAKSYQAVEADVRRMRGETRRRDALRLGGEREIDDLQVEVAALQEECRFVFALLTEYRRSLGARNGPAEMQFLDVALAEIDEALRDDDFSGLPQATGRILELADTWNNGKQTGLVFEGEALDEAGTAYRGACAVVGPVTYFMADGGGAAGMLVTRVGSHLPGIHARRTTDDTAAMSALMAGTESVVTVDVSSGAALKIAAARTPFIERLRQGGVVMIPLVLVGLAAVILSILKIVQLGSVRTNAQETAEQIARLVREGSMARAHEAARGPGAPLSDVLAAAIEHCGASRAHLEEILHERIQNSVSWLERHLGLLAVLGGIAPLLGLLGTVTGMIHTFQLVTIFGTGDAKLLSGGISEALVTTQFGLTIAIPVLLVHAFLVRRVRSILAGLEDAAIELINGLRKDGGSAPAGGQG